MRQETEVCATDPSLESLLDLRKAYSAATDDEARKRVWIDTWKILAKRTSNCEDDPVFLPPLYMGDRSREQIVDSLFASFRMRERMPRRKCETDHIIISGMEGVGKSTILKAFAMAVAVLSNEFSPCTSTTATVLFETTLTNGVYGTCWESYTCGLC